MARTFDVTRARAHTQHHMIASQVIVPSDSDEVGEYTYQTFAAERVVEK